jgi:heme-degrading monooxygenase HmoA
MLDRVYVSMSRLRVPPRRAQRLVSAFRGRVHLVDKAPGFLSLEVWQNDRNRGELVMVSHWTDRACFTAYMKSDAHRVSHDRIDRELVTRRPCGSLERGSLVGASDGRCCVSC